MAVAEAQASRQNPAYRPAGISFFELAVAPAWRSRCRVALCRNRPGANGTLISDALSFDFAWKISILQ
jgi:hypothetical protein